MPPLRPTSLDEARAARRAVPDAVLVAGGTEVMPARLRGERPGPLLDLSRVPELRETRPGDVWRLGALTTFTRAVEELEAPLPVLGLAARTVASRAIRNRATLGGALAVADPSADVLAGLLAAGARVELAGDAARTLDLADFLTGPYATDLGPEEVIAAVHVPAARGPAAYAKVGARNAMARAAVAVAVSLDLADRTAAIAVAAAAPTSVRAPEAEALLAAEAGWDGGPLDPGVLERVGAAVAAATRPRADRRGSVAYKRHAAAVLARRALARAWAARQEPRWA